jgi:hypothetical protein
MAGRRRAAAGETCDHWFPGTEHAIGFQRRGWVALVERLRELRWFKGRNVAIDYQLAEGRSEDLAEITAKLLRSKVDIIVTSGTPKVLAAKQQHQSF